MYVYQEYPKCLYQRNGLTIDVTSEEDEISMAQLGWLTAEQLSMPQAEAVTEPTEEDEAATEPRKKRR
jgi:hypothetical protein